MSNITENKEKLFIHPIFTDYACSLSGQVFSLKFGKLKEIKVDKVKGYLRFVIFNKKIKIRKYVHNFIYECCTKSIPIWGEFNTINHIDENPLNNNFSNLKLEPHRKNVQIQERFKQQNKKSGLPLDVNIRNNNNNITYYVQIYFNGKYIYFGTFESIQAAEEEAIKQRKLLFPNDH